jgi:hypothetical protein
LFLVTIAIQRSSWNKIQSISLLSNEVSSSTLLQGTTENLGRTSSTARSRQSNQRWSSNPCPAWQNSGAEVRCARHPSLGGTRRDTLAGASSFCVGGAISQACLMVAQIQEDLSPQWKGPCQEAAASMARPMSNLLTPPGLIRTKHLPGPINEARNAKLDPMPNQPGAWINTKRGCHCLQVDKVGGGLGLLKAGSKTAVPGALKRTTSVFHWEYLSALLTDRDNASMKAPKVRRAIKVHSTDPNPEPPDHRPFSW